MATALRRVSRQQVYVSVVIALFFLLMLLSNRLENSNAPLHDPLVDDKGSATHRYNLSSGNCTGVTKWVVTTSTTRMPSAAIHVILNLTKDWCVLVLGEVEDLEYNFPWTNSTTRLIYLPYGALSSLPYTLVALASLDARNIGYLYAIANGAKVVLDLEKDKVPIPVGNTYLPLQTDKKDYPSPNLEEKEGGVLWNPYPHFGGKDSWPRGLPHDHIQGDATIGTTYCYPIIQQYLSQTHPDFDASYIANNNNKPFQGFADVAAPALVIPRGVSSPYNSQSTVHLYEALWSLLLPKTVHKRVADIWRSYIAQSLFYLIPDACLMFTPPAVTGGSEESPLYQDELPLYTKSFHVVGLLRYHPLSFDTFEEAFLGIYELMYRSQLVGKGDVVLAEHWIKDLKSVGYEFPRLPKKASLWTKNVHLCIMFNWGSTEYRTRMLLSYYMRFFDAITLFLEGERTDHSYVPSHVQVFYVKTNHGYLQQISLELCIKQPAPNTVGHLYVADDMFINITKMNQLSSSNIWFIPISEHSFGDYSSFQDGWNWWAFSYDTVTQYQRFVMVVKSLPDDLKQVLTDQVGFPGRIHGHAVADIVYIPNSYAASVARVLRHIRSVTEIFCEIAIPLAVDIAQPVGREEMEDGNLWESDRLRTDLVKSFIETRYYMHAMKLSTRFGADMWCKCMNNQLRLLV